jgi:hypothetical protein
MVDASGTLLVKDVFKLEELQAKWPLLRHNICGMAACPYADGGLSKKNPSRHKHYSFYYDAETRRIVHDYMAADVTAFGYTFEDTPNAARDGAGEAAPGAGR